MKKKKTAYICSECAHEMPLNWEPCTPRWECQKCGFVNCNYLAFASNVYNVGIKTPSPHEDEGSEVLYDETVLKKEEYAYKIYVPSPNPHPIKQVDIIFVNDKFCEVVFNFSNPYTEREWDTLAAITAKIKEIKKSKKEK